MIKKDNKIIFHILCTSVICPLLGGGGSWNRRASDGGANIQLFARQICQGGTSLPGSPGSQEALPTLNQSSAGLQLPTLQGSVTVEENEDGGSDQEPDPEAVQR